MEDPGSHRIPGAGGGAPSRRGASHAWEHLSARGGGGAFFLIWLTRSFGSNYSGTSREGWRRWLAACSKSNLSLVDFEVNSGDARPFFWVREKEWLFSSRVEVAFLLPPKQTFY